MTGAVEVDGRPGHEDRRAEAFRDAELEGRVLHLDAWEVGRLEVVDRIVDWARGLVGAPRPANQPESVGLDGLQGRNLPVRLGDGKQAVGNGPFLDALDAQPRPPGAIAHTLLQQHHA